MKVPPAGLNVQRQRHQVLRRTEELPRSSSCCSEASGLEMPDKCGGRCGNFCMEGLVQLWR